MKKTQSFKVLITGCLVLLLVLLPTGCKKQSEQTNPGDAANQGPPPTFHLVTHGIAGEMFWATVAKGWADACALYNIDGKFVPVRMEDNVAEMLGNLETVVAYGSDGIACVISDYKMLEEPLNIAIEKGIPVVAVNTRDFRPDDQRIAYLAYVGEGSYEVGQANAQAVLDKFQQLAGRPPKHAIYMVHAVGVQCVEQRGLGMQDVFDKTGTRFTKVACKFNPVTTQESIRAFIANNPDVETVHSACSLVAHWSMEILQQMGKLGNTNEDFKEGNVYVGGIDMDEMLLKDILRGDVIATIDQQPYLQGYYAAEMLYMYHKYGFLLASDILTGPYVVDQTNAAQRIEQLQLIAPK